MHRSKALFLLVSLALSSCGGGDSACCSNLPSGGLYATFAVGGELFQAAITHPDGIAQAKAHWQGASAASIPTGELVCQQRAWNQPWHWHLAPETVRMAEVTEEV